MKGTAMKAKPKKTAARKPAKKKPPQKVIMIPVDPIPAEKIPRRPRIVTKEKRCPICGETAAIRLDRSYFGGKKIYQCFSENCRPIKAGYPPRSFVVNI